jgi:hypothetical protein
MTQPRSTLVSLNRQPGLTANRVRSIFRVYISALHHRAPSAIMNLHH